MGKFSKFKRKVDDKVKRVRASYQITKQAIGEIKRAKSVEELLAKHLKRGFCNLCGKETDLIKTVGKCVSCSTKGDKWAKQFKKVAIPGLCVSCASRDLVSKKESLCFNCYIKKVMK